MDQIKIGRFISLMRKEKGLTQRELADKLGVSDKTVSKWECGKGLPEVSFMLPLCEELDISVNELLTGEKMNADEYKKYAEDNIMKLINEKQENKKKILLSIITCFVTIVAAVALILVSGLGVLPTLARVVLITVAILVMAGGIIVAAVLDMDAGVYECTKCGHRFVPEAKAYIMGAHTITRRNLRCPECGKKNYCIRRLSQKDND